MTRGRAGLRGASLAAALVLLVGCLGKPAPRDRYFRLELAAPAPLAAPALPGVLEVERLRANSVVRRTALVRVSDASARELHTRAYDHWADSPTLLVQREMASYLRAAGIADRVVTPEHGAPPDWRLEGELVRFEERRGNGVPRVVVEIELVLLDATQRTIRLQRSYREERAAAGPAAEDAVRAYDSALGAVLARFVTDVGGRR